MILKIRMTADMYKVYETKDFTRTLISPKEIDEVAGYKDGVILRIADGLPNKDSKTYKHKSWKRITIVDDKHTHILYTPNEIYVLNDNGKTIDVL